MTLADRLIGAFRRLLHRPAAPAPLPPDALRRQLVARHRFFRDLLAANNNALEAMAEMEQALHDGRTLSMVFIRAKCTLVTVNVYKIIHSLNRLADDRYAELNPVFARLQQQLDQLLKAEQQPVAGDLILPLTHIRRQTADLTGEKMANLGEVAGIAGMRVPPGFALTSAATRLFFQANALYPAINHILQQLDITDLVQLHERSEAIRRLILDRPLPPELEAKLLSHYDELAAATEPDVRVAMRSSALGEDLGQASFAGLYHTELEVDRAHLIEAYKSVLASKYSPRAISYRLAKGFRHEETEMCVGCLAMVHARTSGVCYSRAIGGGVGVMDLFFAAGGARGVVDGTHSTGHLLVERATPHRVLRRQPAPEGEAELDDSEAARLAAIAMRLEEHFGAAQDIEWSIDAAGEVVVLQSRPISTALPPEALQAEAAADDERLILRGGVTGCRGAGSGPVCVVRTAEDMLRFPNRAILVVIHPLPEWAPLLKRAAALIAETGSEAGHLATIAREYGLPALLSLTGASEQLTEGETVTVDASGRAVYRGRIDELLTEAPAQPSPMAGSPVQRVLIAALALISPLHLTDPSSADFTAANCRTLHDITRFCHERSVIELFAFGSRHHGSAATARRLADSLPMEWWVIDLGDGFRPGLEAGDESIVITDIVSVPMLAIWQGMHAVCWQGPPTAGPAATASFLLQAAIRSALDPNLSSALLQRNYFLISQNYCNLSLRLGYHYAMIEARTSGRPVDRYITFRFKGGAADDGQRRRRIELLAEVLARFDFHIDLVGDALTARVERADEAFLCERLRVLGFLTIHTRQLDLAMTDAGAHRFYRDRFIHEIEAMLSNDQ